MGQEKKVENKSKVTKDMIGIENWILLGAGLVFLGIHLCIRYRINFYRNNNIWIKPNKEMGLHDAQTIFALLFGICIIVFTMNVLSMYAMME